VSGIERFSSGGRWEPIMGYSRTVRAGGTVLVSGTTAATPDGEVAGEGDMGAQTRACLAAIERALALAGARLEQVVRTRVYTTDISRWEEIARAHGEVFGAIRPVNSLVEVSALIDPRMLVEIEAQAYAPLPD
jgi:enamine deaminase RidA (YjgF/YER057c/UK114 family)